VVRLPSWPSRYRLATLIDDDESWETNSQRRPPMAMCEPVSDRRIRQRKPCQVPSVRDRDNVISAGFSRVRSKTSKSHHQGRP
jgi:hypothetical protein